MSEAPLAAVLVLAAGEGRRMRSATPKVLHQLAGRSLLGHVLAAVGPLPAAAVVVVVPPHADPVGAALRRLAPDARPVPQRRPRGTADATRLALAALGQAAGTVLVVPGDTPLLRTETLAGLLAAHLAGGAAATLLTARLADPTGYGRVLRDEQQRVRAVVEERDADPDVRRITEVATSVYAFDAATLWQLLARTTDQNAAGEHYLTDVVGLLTAAGGTVDAVGCPDGTEVLGVNDQVQLATARRLLRDRLLTAAMRAGAAVEDPASTWVDVDVTLAADSVVRPNTELRGRTTVAAGATVGPGCTLVDTEVHRDASVRYAVCEGAVIGPGATVGPFTYLRPGTRLGPGAKAGGFVEMKNADVGAGSKVPHLSYVGDAAIGENSNIGAATVFVNYDGRDKHRSTVGDEVRIGSDTMLVAPVRVGDGAYTAAGSVITADVPPGALAVARGRQRNVEGWVDRARPGSPSARAAARARGRPGVDREREETG